MKGETREKKLTPLCLSSTLDKTDHPACLPPTYKDKQWAKSKDNTLGMVLEAMVPAFLNPNVTTQLRTHFKHKQSLGPSTKRSPLNPSSWIALLYCLDIFLQDWIETGTKSTQKDVLTQTPQGCQ